MILIFKRLGRFSRTHAVWLICSSAPYLLIGPAVISGPHVFVSRLVHSLVPRSASFLLLSLFGWQLSADGEAYGERSSKNSWDSLLLYGHAWDHTAILIPPANITMAMGLSSFPLCHITRTRTCARTQLGDSWLIIGWHARQRYNHLRWFSMCVCVCVCEQMPACTYVCVLTPVTSMTLMAASCPVLTCRPWWREERDRETRSQRSKNVHLAAFLMKRRTICNRIHMANIFMKHPVPL